MNGNNETGLLDGGNLKAAGCLSEMGKGRKLLIELRTGRWKLFLDETDMAA